MMLPIRFRLGCLFASLLAGISANAATIDAVVPEVTAGEDYLAPTTILGTAGPFWTIPFMAWDQTGEVSLSVPVTNDSGTVLHPVFITVSNSTADRWVGFELEVSGPATFSNVILASINITSDPVVLAPNSRVFTGLDWEPDGFTPTISFSLDVIDVIDVTPPLTNEPLVLTLRPVSVPEPGTGVLFVLGTTLLRRRRGR